MSHRLAEHFVNINGIVGVSILLSVLALSPLAARANDKNDEYRVTVFPTHLLFGQRDWIGIGYLGYVENGDKNFDVTYLGAGTIWKFSDWGEWWFVLIGTWTDNESTPDVVETRPVVGFKNYFPNLGRAKFYNFARAEYRVLDREGADDSEYLRVRDRLGIEFPLGGVGAESQWYGLADAELFYRFDKNISDLGRLRVGVGWIINDHVRAEFIYHMQFTRDTPDEHFEWTDNIWRLNFKVAREKGLLRRLWHSDGDE